ncbi:hypothetical protein [Kineobactrum salinum]|uniref:Tetratricopeptide repeat protein n=1 Tax=Kineobactrum salinum TaxID=2708301 RepID=A0A6C0U821_9GAMM|nr:hypothetical protein [Kineobactrum salinum]QIB66625.1 hypothetical protein G3T16_15745 [Kineobactrum salinum]
MRQALGFGAWAPLLVLVLLLVAVSWLYAPGIHGPALLDDRSSIAVLGDLGVTPRVALDQILGDGSGPLGRPVTMATFVAERFWPDADVATSKTVNIILHGINGVLVVWLFTLLLRSERYPHAFWLGVLGGGLWLASPLFVSTVLYVVQRMAMLATTFMLLALIAYIYWRQRFVRGRSHAWLAALVPACVLLAVYSKESGVVVLPVLVLLELLWFGCRNPDGGRNPWLWRGCWILSAGGAALVVAVFLLVPERLLAHYSLREFTLDERLLTEARILWDYLGQLLWPEVGRMGLYHDDIVVSRSLTDPASTGLAVVGWALVGLLLIIGCRWSLGRQVSFCVLFFLAGHSTESTVLPLELYFEHRNYFPAIGLFLVPALLAATVARRWPVLASPLLAWLGVAILLLTLQTSSQVQLWSDSRLLRFHQVIAHPHSFRANADMAVLYAQAGALSPALEYSRRAHEAGTEQRGDRYIRNLALACIAGKALPVDAQPGPRSLESARPLSSVATMHVFVDMLQDGRCPQLDWIDIANRLASVYLRPGAGATAAADMYSVLAVLENALERYENAYRYTVRFLASEPNNTRGLLMQLHFTTALGKVEEARILKQQLLALQASGELSVADQQTLALYLEQD